jgi:hypothetical protein
MASQCVELIGGPFDGDRYEVDLDLDRLNLFSTLHEPPRIVAPAERVERERRRIAVYRRGKLSQFVFTGWDYL